MGFMPYADLLGPSPTITVRDSEGRGADAVQFGHLLKACEHAGRVTVVLDSSGGNVPTALALWGALKDFPGEVTTIVRRALSAAGIIAMGGSKRLIEAGGRIGVHQPHVVVEKGGQRSVEEVAALNRDLMASANALAAIYATASGTTDVQYWLSEMKREASYNPQEAIQRGLVHDIIPAGQSGQVRAALADVPPNLLREIKVQSLVAGAVGAGVILAKRAQDQRQAARNGGPRWAKSGLFGS